MSDYDVVIIGAAVSGVSAAYYLQKNCPDKTFTILETRDAIGGTWDIFKYPGVRSDSDMFTYSYDFKPWLHDDLISPGGLILDYVREAADQFGITQKVQFRKKVVAAAWSTKNSEWSLEIEDLSNNTTSTVTCQFVSFCTGFYNNEQGYTPDFKGMDDFQGQILHPQHWDENLDYKDKKVVIIGSGATTMTLAPVVAETAQHVTVVQRSPGYVLSWPTKAGKLLKTMRSVLSAQTYSSFLKGSYLSFQIFLYKLMKKYPEKSKQNLIAQVDKQVDGSFDVKKHFTPTYYPWDERLCLITDGDLFKQINKGNLSFETDEIDGFIKKGLKLKSGKEIEADIIVTATGFNLEFGGNVNITVDGEPRNVADSFVYRGMIFSGIPNHAFWFGYFNASYTLKVDATSDYFTRLIKYMDENNFKKCVAPNSAHPNVQVDTGFNPGYVQRNQDKFPKFGSEYPWNVSFNPKADRKNLKQNAVNDSVLTFS